MTKHVQGRDYDPAGMFHRAYWEDGTTGYTMYADFPVHYFTTEEILKRRPESVLEIGGARGYIIKRLEDRGIRALCMDVSPHCWHTRATDSFVLQDITRVPWPFRRNEFDLCFSIATLEHLPEDRLDMVLEEMARVCRRGLMGITFSITPEDTDATHRRGTIKPKEWWEDKFHKSVPAFPVEIVDKEDLEKGPIHLPGSDGLVKLNLGCYMNMYHYGWINIDGLALQQWAKANGYVFHQADLVKGIPFGNDSVDIINASHLIEHFTRDEALRFIQECWRVLKPTGVVRITTPDAVLLAGMYTDGAINTYAPVNVGVENASDDAEAFFNLMMAGHKTIWDFTALKKLLEKKGFEDIQACRFSQSRSQTIRTQTIGMYPTLSLYVEARPRK